MAHEQKTAINATDWPIPDLVVLTVVPIDPLSKSGKETHFLLHGSMRLHMIHARYGLRNIFQNVIDLKTQIAEELADQAAADEKDGVVIAVGCGGTRELCH
jgi:dihydroxyacetone kinase